MVGAGGSIERLASLETARAVHTTTALPSGDLLVAGGMGAGGRSLATAELIDVSAGTVSAVASMTQPRAGHTATALPDGRVVLAGGYNGKYLSSVEVYDPARKRFAMMGQLTEGRSGHTATMLPDGRILIVGERHRRPARQGAASGAHRGQRHDRGWTGIGARPAERRAEHATNQEQQDSRTTQQERGRPKPPR